MGDGCTSLFRNRMMRLFFALWPDAATQQQWHHEFSPYLALLGGRRMPAQNLHLTLAFLGEQPGDRINTLISLGDDLSSDSISLRFNNIECWKKAGLACLRPAETPVALTRLVGQLNTGLQMAGIALEARGFKPHVTLARDIAVTGPAIPVWPASQWQAPALALLRSRLSPEGPEYAVLHEWPLGD